MTARDSLGQILAENDVVLFPVALGTSVPATILKINSVVGAEPGAQPSVSIQFNLSVPVSPNGVVGQVVKVASAPALDK